MRVNPVRTTAEAAEAAPAQPTLVAAAAGPDETDRFNSVAAAPLALATRAQPTATRASPSLLELAGAGQADPAVAQRIAAEVVARAKANKAQGTPNTFLEPANVPTTARAMLGLNQGPDETVEADLLSYSTERSALYVFDRAGFQVMKASISTQHGDGSLWMGLAASHGRNCSELSETGPRAEGKVPGRGNALLVAAGLEAMIVEGTRHGVYRVGCSPASDQVAKLYAQMGFKREDGEEPAARKDMWMDLTDEAVVNQALLTFTLGRAAFHDVPKDVAAKLKARGESPSVRSHDQWLRSYPKAIRITPDAGEGT